MMKRKLWWSFLGLVLFPVGLYALTVVGGGGSGGTGPVGPAGPAGGGSSGDKITSTTMTVVNGDETNSFQIASTTKGYMNANNFVFHTSGSIANATGFNEGVALHVGPAGENTSATLANVIAMFQRSGTAKVNVRDVLNNVETDFGASSTGGSMGTVTSNSFGINTNNTNRLTIAAGGNVGIGTTISASSILDIVAGSITVRGANAGISVAQGANNIINTPRLIVGSTQVVQGAILKVSTSNGYAGPIVSVSTGGTTLFEVNGASIMAKVTVFGPDGNPYVTSVAGDNLGNHVMTNHLNAAGFSLFNVSSVSFAPGPAGSVVLYTTTETLVNFQTGETPTTRFEIGTSSVVIPTTVNLIATSTETYTPWLYNVNVASTVYSTPTAAGYGELTLGRLDSTGTYGVYKVMIDSWTLTDDPRIQIIVESTGTQQDDVWMGVAIGSPSLNGSGRDDVIWQSSTVVICSSQTVGFLDRIKQSKIFSIAGSGNMFGAKRNHVFLLKVWRIPLAGSSNIIHQAPTIYWCKRPT